MDHAAPLPTGGLAVVFGASGAIGGAIAERLRVDPRFADVLAFSRSGTPSVDVTDEAAVAEAAEAIKTRGLAPRLVVVATGFLHGAGQQPEKTWRHLDGAALARSFAVNAIGPALVLKHVLPLVPRDGRSVVAALSARAASSENTLGGWYGYRASKAALNQLVRSAAAELCRRSKEAVCVTLYPGHVESDLSAPFGVGAVGAAHDRGAPLTGPAAPPRS
ncbi:MAG: SDR family oxidoreductase [Trueperaceae bacterium]|nr:SDR family oxidoreductase [Trueperaceae bacterium]